jgi:NAD(P)-dependent dehydrogenase (short-subunit alcohol dehydrogenase family)
MPVSELVPQRILVTGAASGIGLAIVRRLLRQGAAVVLADRNEDGLKAARDGLGVGSDRAACITADVTDEQAIGRMMEAAGSPITGLVNCAGIYPVTPLLDLAAAEWDRVLSINLRAPFLMMQAVARHMIAAGTGGSIVNISSTASVLARPGIAHYGASKAGLNQLTRVLAVELAPHKIRVNAILPGVIATGTVAASLTTPAAEAEMQAKLARIPMGRLGTPDEIAELAAFLLSDAASYSTGGLYMADGGFSLGMARY